MPQLAPLPDSATVPAEERQVNLLLALRNTETGLTNTQIISTVAGYNPDGGASSQRMFERDKAVLRDLGIEITTTGVGAQARYRITEANYALPDLRLTAAQAAAIELAASAWRSGALTPEAQHALTKIRAVAAPDADSARLPDLSIDLGSDVSGVQVPAELAAAVQERRRVTFNYASAGSGNVGTRTVEPHQLRLSEGAWYLDALDLASGQQRTFRLARVAGAVSVVSDAGAFPAVEYSVPTPAQAVLAVAPGRALQLRARAQATRSARCPRGWDEIDVTYVDRFAFAGTLAALADAVVVLAPQELREDVMSHLEAVSAWAPAALEGE
ncbi:helix-turn-helix transcriptional regulator [Actinomyces qiguomingii]|uniref:helix-turn-helix transcriptional regulator n=1 Tax=Actinomyces qiguomingii TaxID=2057800 RepID=UPI000CA051A7|nr:WYL domain-containing protein [Actinomyces qiguomingii]